MTIRTAALTLAGAGVLASVLTPVAGAHADNWRFVRVYRALSACQTAGHGLVSRRQAREYRCENDYDKAGVPVLDLYAR
ncbi:hypothetical protein GCM10027176_27150 [Actinoallomurus bryophytorum]|uniref:Uncharacterized protein n=1 Tax=Actinoallomurus bryophytorum TaxID=1490222 RepID=A0A543CPW3_9ACTN|nr:hypothetical protein [Actinoallomurus bryophytorum]TQL99148.1 hypothetical protein FB559_4804 [Actinoallomurus bryophytorum]